MNYQELRYKYPVFSYEQYDYKLENGMFTASFRFKTGEHEFCPTLTILHRDFYQWDILHKAQLDLLVFHIGMIELISYWKAVCAPKVVIKPHSLSPKQIDFWKKIYFHGLGEFFYLNKIDARPADFMEIEAVEGVALSKQTFVTTPEVMVPIGGGKDSVVTLELLKEAGEKVMPMIVNPRGATLSCVKMAGYDQDAYIEVQRTIDKHLLELNAAGYLNGHTPFSALLAFLTLLPAAAAKYQHIALSNEASANESTVPGTQVNHQYSKSFEFEKDFRDYVAEFITDDFNYFSFLRPVHELDIAGLFAQYPAYFEVFKSCNVGSKQDIWCGHCSKCLFAFIILSPFIPKETMHRIFHKNLLDDWSLKPVFDELIGLSMTKPFECVGTVDEVHAALQKLLVVYQENLPCLLVYYQTLASSKIKSGSHFIFASQNHFLKPRFEKILKDALENIQKKNA